MTRLHLAVGMMFFLALTSCSHDDDPVPEPDNTPLQLVKKITRREIGGSLKTDSTAYTYDAEAHLTAVINLSTTWPLQKMLYTGDNMTALITYINEVPDTLENPVSLSNGGNTIVVDFTRPVTAAVTDTTLVTYQWQGDKLLESSTYLHLVTPPMQSLQRKVFSHDAAGNETEQTTIPGIGDPQVDWRILEFDQQKNYFHDIPRLNYIFGTWGFPYATRSINNPVKAELYGEVVEYSWTYNAAGYPLTMKVKGKDYVAAEFYYNR
ncbi:hypothetical protein [Flavihumibacter petaseus]|uniref:DUF4595 domain-containing protein n=1 Tax=Flavihumibacter petaseus NBRC 106054 TaxID=1220578 RepID=A0A0E9MZE4_9BACT|nr:hypothetical protein [Flavihumibacter petaseus]GAO43117.1 hypothetical protein FPE01S_02_02210 [Flavihumibacter petaseus NBRC 106054]